MHGILEDGQFAGAIAYVAATAGGVKVVEVRFKRLQTHVEVVISQGDVLITAEIHRQRAGMGTRRFPGDKGGEGRTLQHVSPVDHQRVPIALEGGLELEKAHRHLILRGVIRRKEIAVDVGCVEYFQLAHSVLPPHCAGERRR